MLSVVLFAHVAAGSIARDSYGVPTIEAESPRQAFRLLGKAIAEDRLWQMEMSRHLFRGKMCELTGSKGIASDKDILRTAYTDQELQEQLSKLSPMARDAFAGYAEGVNDTIQARSASGTLPPGYAQMGFKPEPWTTTDSAAIAVGLARRFGAGGAGEIRNLFAVNYLQTQKCKANYLDVLDDFLWQNEGDSPCTLQGPDTPPEPKGFFPTISRGGTQKHLAQLPAPGLGELMPGLRLMQHEESTKVAMQMGVPYKTGSYCIVVDKKHSATGENLLLSGPQMGHTSPSIVAEAALEAPGLKVAGITVPGIPTILIGHTPNFAWGLTTGVQDTQDIFFSPRLGESTYAFQGKSKALTSVTFTLHPKGEAPVDVVQYRTHYGPVVIDSPTTKTVFSLKSSFWGKELEAYSQVLAMYSLTSAQQLAKHAEKIPVGFNLFFATQKDIGYAYCGIMPRRSAQVDPRFPVPGTGAYDWQGTVPCATLVHSINPGKGILLNWNNKPVSWWPNLDTPVWGSLFRNQLLWDQLPKTSIKPEDLIGTVQRASHYDDQTENWFRQPFLKYVAGSDAESAAKLAIMGFNGEQTKGDAAPVLMGAFVEELRKSIFVPHVGNLFLPDFFNAAIQPSLIKRAIEGGTRYDFFVGRDRGQVILDAFKAASKRVAGKTFIPGVIRYDADHVAEYGNRGTYIQLVQLEQNPFVRTILGPGQAESGAHQWDQVPLVQEWKPKPGHSWGK